MVADQRLGQEVCGQPADLRPRAAVLLAAPPERARRHRPLTWCRKSRQGRAVGRHGMVAEEAANHLSGPFPLLGDRLVSAPHQLDLDRLELGAHPIAPRMPHQQELGQRRLRPQMCVSPRKLNRLAEPASSTVPRSKAADRRVFSGCIVSANTPQIAVPRRPGSALHRLRAGSRRRYRRMSRTMIMEDRRGRLRPRGPRSR
jgi:hypothetical protein